MDPSRQDVWDYVVVGYPVRVFRRTGSGWGVAVDGREFSVDCGHPYQAWAVGVAECYRLGARTRPAPRVADRDLEAAFRGAAAPAGG